MKKYIPTFDKISLCNDKEVLKQMLQEFEQERYSLRREKFIKGQAMDTPWHDEIIKKLKAKIQ